jgi:hypothetical protein
MPKDEKPLVPSGFPVNAEGKKIKKQDGTPVLNEDVALDHKQTSIFVYRMSCFAQVGRLHAYREQYFEDAVKILRSQSRSLVMN